MMWGVARIKSNQVALAICNLERQGFPTFNPTFSRRIVVRNKVVRRPEPLFPTYLFVCLAPGQRWVPINSTHGVLRLLVRRGTDGYDEPSIIQDDFIVQLRRCCEAKDALKQRAWQLKPGTTVRILNGPFTMHDGIVTWSSELRVRLLVYLLNRSVPLELSVTDIAAIDPPAASGQNLTLGTRQLRLGSNP
jgi:transcriptional antiterminator RfaH